MRRVAVVTGAGSGIGRAVSLALLRDGYSVALVGRRPERLSSTANESSRDDHALVLPADVTDEDAVAGVFASVHEHLGRLDLLFNNAGIAAPPVPLDDLTLAQWQAVVDVNLTGMFLCTKAAIAIMKAQEPRGGRIINNGSVSAQAPRPNSAPYTATKHAVTGFTKSVSLDGRKHNIACGQIDVGNAATEMSDQFATGVEQANGMITVEPRMDVDDVARAVLYMANLPLEANVQLMTLMATAMPLIGRG